MALLPRLNLPVPSSVNMSEQFNWYCLWSSIHHHHHYFNYYWSLFDFPLKMLFVFLKICSWFFKQRQGLSTSVYRGGHYLLSHLYFCVKLIAEGLLFLLGMCLNYLMAVQVFLMGNGILVFECNIIPYAIRIGFWGEYKLNCWVSCCFNLKSTELL